MTTLDQRIRGVTSLRIAGHGRTRIVAGIALLAAPLLSCQRETLLDVTNPDVLNVQDYNTAAGATPLRIGVIANFTQAFDGGTDSFTTITGNMADELLASDTFDDRLTINARKSLEINTNMESVYRTMHRARSGAARAAIIIAQTAPTPTFNRGELYMLRGITEDFFAEGWCSGVPFSSEDGVTTTFGPALTTDQILTAAVATFDTALSLADTSKRVRYGAEIGKARALLNLGRFADAAAAVGDVPQSFVLTTSHSVQSTSNGMWSATTSGASRYRLVSTEGVNGLPFLSQPTSAEPRIPWAPSTRVGFSSQFTNQPNELKFGQFSDGIVGNGIEAALIKLEARLQGGAQSDRQAVYDGLNALRASGPPVVAPMTTGAPTTQDAAIDLLYKERAYWMWLTGHRLGDLRRLVRIYKRDPEKVFPTGTLTSPLVGSYGTSTSITIPFSERNNPNYKGCLPGA
jgi:hypothetical protein